MKSIVIIVLFLQSMAHSSCAQSAGDYRSKQTGAWNLATSWQTYNGSSWINASVAPSASDGITTILSGHIITSSTVTTIDQLVINAGGTLSIDAGTFTVNDGAGTDLDGSGTMTLSGGVLNGIGVVNFISGSSFNWTGGTISGSGIITINSGADINMNGADVTVTGTKTIDNYGTWTWTSGNLIYDNASPVINNYNVLNIYTDADVTSLNGSTGSFNNKSGGIINKLGSPGDETLCSGSISFSNEGTINVNSSKLKLSVDLINTGAINVAFGADMNFVGGSSQFNTGTMLAGSGHCNFEGGTAVINDAIITITTINISGGTVTWTPDFILANGNEVNLSGGVLNGPNNFTLDSASSFNWTGGNIAGNGTMTINSGANFTMNGDLLYLSDARTINNYGTWDWLNGTFYFNGGSPTVNNYGVFNMSTDADQTGDGTFDNKPGGIINKIGSPTDETSLGGTNFLNEGTIHVNSSKLKPYVTTVNTDTISVAFGANMNFTGTSDFNTGSVFTGAGTLNFDGGTAMVNDASFSIATINISGSIVTLTPDLLLNSGYTLNLSLGSLIGDGNITFNTGSTFNWSGGIHGGNSVTTINSGASFNMSGGLHSISDTRTINNHSVCSWNGGDIYFSNGDPVLNNYGVFNIHTDDDITQFNTNADAFNNKSSGIINKEGSATEETAVTDITAFNNSGTIHVISGNLQLNTGGTHDGNYEVDFGGGLTGSVNMSFLGNSFINNGTVDILNLNFDGSSVQTWDGEGFISRTTITNSVGTHLLGTQTITSTITIIPNSKLKVFGHLIVL